MYFFFFFNKICEIIKHKIEHLLQSFYYRMGIQFGMEINFCRRKKEILFYWKHTIIVETFNDRQFEIFNDLWFETLKDRVYVELIPPSV